EREICFGDMAMLSDLVKMAAVKKGHIGEMLAMGSQALSQELGRDSSRLLYTSKGLEIPGHSARAIDTMGLAYATATRGGSHHDARPLYSDAPMAMDAQVDYCIESQNNTVIGDCLVMCRFIQERALGTALNDAYIPLIRYVTGWDMDIEELDLIAQRVYNLERWINCSRGAGRNKDSLPWRVMNEPVIDGPSKGKFCPPERLTDLLDRYYRKRGWDTKGIPLPETLKRLGIIEDSNYSGSRLERE
ncbi:MAG: aldehyde ferredoxin oxidoreductase C-terminal domain-containing protein, partial [Thermodesulfobacteriota bacterium]|nr:aldehyde ferredoxin oxidoreductase C-terminal domain-containing protein [Thermodesulfobacteriota bacterium]